MRGAVVATCDDSALFTFSIPSIASPCQIVSGKSRQILSSQIFLHFSSVLFPRFSAPFTCLNALIIALFMVLVWLVLD